MILLSGARANLLRPRGGHAQASVTSVELFFDLVFVFAVTQLSHGLLEHLTWSGLVQTAMLLMAVWWVWIYTSWITNWLDPRRLPVRVMLFALMLAGLVLSASIPEAFGDRGLAFAGAYTFMQIGRTLFMLWAVRRHNERSFRNFQRVFVWLAVSGLLWIGGGFAEGPARLVLWALALAIEYLGPSLGFRAPALGRSTTADWDIDGAHLAERCGLFIIIALGESILVTGATFAELEWTRVNVMAFLVAFLGSVAMWWIYFNIGAERASRRIAEAADPGRMGRLAYTYIHIAIVAGIIVSAVADELVLAHPTGHTAGTTLATVVGGPAIYLVGNMLFKRTVAARLPLSHLIGLALLAALVPLGDGLSPLALGGAVAAILVLVAAWESISLRSYRREASPA